MRGASKLEPLCLYPLADSIRMQLEGAHLASTPVFTLFIQVSPSRMLAALFYSSGENRKLAVGSHMRVITFWLPGSLQLSATNVKRSLPLQHLPSFELNNDFRKEISTQTQV